MKRNRVDIKKRIKKRIELNSQKYVFINKKQINEHVKPLIIKKSIEKNEMSRENNLMRIFGITPATSNQIIKEISILYNTDKRDIKLSVGIPCYNGNDIAWLCMEGLCNQVNVSFDWEIIICEEIHEKQIGREFFSQYINRLLNIGCKKITYIELSNWISLSEKWKIIGQNLDNYDGGFVLQAIDCYPPSERLVITHELINLDNHDWIDFNRGYFYSFINDKLILYDSAVYDKVAKTNLHMAFKSKYAQYLESSSQKSGIDGLLLKTISKINPNIQIFTCNKLLPDGIDTDGYNNISKRRINNYVSIGFPFVKTDKTIEEIGLPNHIIENIKKMIINE